MIGAFSVHSSYNRLVQGMIMGLLVHRLLFHIAVPVIISGSRSKTRRLEEGTMRIASSFLYLAIIMLILPSIFKMSSSDSGSLVLLKISRWCAVFLFILLGFLLYYTAKMETKFWESTELVRSATLFQPPFRHPSQYHASSDCYHSSHTCEF